MSFKLSTPKPLINHPNISEKCSSYRVRKDEKINTLSMSLILDESTKQKLQEFITETKIESSKIFYGKNQDTIYVKLTSSQIRINHPIQQQKQSSNQTPRRSRQRTRKKKAPSKKG